MVVVVLGFPLKRTIASDGIPELYLLTEKDLQNKKLHTPMFNREKKDGEPNYLNDDTERKTLILSCMQACIQ